MYQPKSTVGGTSAAFTIAMNYVLQFYPLWFSYHQFRNSKANRLVGPDRISPIYHSVVAINDDTLYASGFLDLRAQPVILTIPETTATYSTLMLDPYGNTLSSGIPAMTPGTFGLVRSGFSGTLPADVTPISMPLDISLIIFRIDKFSTAGLDQIADASTFRNSLNMLSIEEYQRARESSAGQAAILPEIAFSIPFKQTADYLSTQDTLAFLEQLQTAVTSPNTPPMSEREQELSNTFDDIFRRASTDEPDLITGTQKAHAAIVSNYLDHTIPRTKWIHFTNIGTWGDAVLDRSSIAEYLQYANNISTAAYYHSFHDKNGALLDGSKTNGYVLTFPAGHLPAAKRFWSLTAYTEGSIELIKNDAKKYVVASYTPGLVPNADGSVSVFMARELPAGVPVANWLPVSDEPFNIMLRVYGPEGSVANNTYVPPGIELR